MKANAIEIFQKLNQPRCPVPSRILFSFTCIMFCFCDNILKAVYLFDICQITWTSSDKYLKCNWGMLEHHFYVVFITNMSDVGCQNISLQLSADGWLCCRENAQLINIQIAHI